MRMKLRFSSLGPSVRALSWPESRSKVGYRVRREGAAVGPALVLTTRVEVVVHHRVVPTETTHDDVCGPVQEESCGHISQHDTVAQENADALSGAAAQRDMMLAEVRRRAVGV